MQQKGLRLIALQQVNNRLLKPSYLGLFIVHAMLAAWCCAHQGLRKVQNNFNFEGGGGGGGGGGRGGWRGCGGGWHFCSCSLTNVFNFPQH